MLLAELLIRTNGKEPRQIVVCFGLATLFCVNADQHDIAYVVNWQSLRPPQGKKQSQYDVQYPNGVAGDEKTELCRDG